MKTWFAMVAVATALTGCVLPPPGHGHGGHMEQGHRHGPSGHGPHGGPGGHHGGPGHR